MTRPTQNLKELDALEYQELKKEALRLSKTGRWTDASISRRLRVSKSTIRDWIRMDCNHVTTSRRRVTPDYKREITELLIKGTSPFLIERALGISRNTLKTWKARALEAQKAEETSFSGETKKRAHLPLP